MTAEKYQAYRDEQNRLFIIIKLTCSVIKIGKKHLACPSMISLLQVEKKECHEVSIVDFEQWLRDGLMIKFELK